MTRSLNAKALEALKPCPFCGGEAERVDIEDGDNAGGSFVHCTRCDASGNVEFEFKENFISNWNRRALSALPQAGTVSEEMVSRALAEVGSAWDIHMSPESKRHLMRTALEAALSLRQQEEAVQVEQLANCCNCGRIVDTREEADGGDSFGCELSDGRWTCSGDCWEVATGDASPVPADAGAQVAVERIECVSYDTGYEMPADPIWRIEIDGYCADFEFETAARNFAAAINSRFVLVPADAGEPSIKALEWNPFRAETPFGYYHIDDQTDRTSEELKARAPFLLSGSRLDYSRHLTLADAKAAAQADYEARIRSALTRVPATSQAPAPDAWATIAERYRQAMIEAGQILGSIVVKATEGPVAEINPVAVKITEAQDVIRMARDDTIFEYGPAFLNTAPIVPATSQAKGSGDEATTLLREARQWFGDGEQDDGIPREYWTEGYRDIVDRVDAFLARSKAKEG